jgi:hypothetical protein
VNAFGTALFRQREWGNVSPLETMQARSKAVRGGGGGRGPMYH